ncbi:(d)CMP kinase, partial [Myxococcota bacterium]|nr:(d)CMP kinase [Myxococcota bacterium]MBU1534097.1 (d)CMP kinase [Myxococcota bacterium]
VCEGRDMGTVVFPQAPVKFFLTATPEARARRRHDELSAKGDTISFDDVLAQQNERDQRDSSRDVAPLKPAQDAVLVDSTAMTIEEVILHMVAIARSRLNS